MSVRVSKQAALTLYCYCRQAERSVHYALACPKQWLAFRAYYDGARRHSCRFPHDNGTRRPTARPGLPGFSGPNQQRIKNGIRL